MWWNIIRVDQKWANNKIDKTSTQSSKAHKCPRVVILYPIFSHLIHTFDLEFRSFWRGHPGASGSQIWVMPGISGHHVRHVYHTEPYCFLYPNMISHDDSCPMLVKSHGKLPIGSLHWFAVSSRPRLRLVWTEQHPWRGGGPLQRHCRWHLLHALVRAGPGILQMIHVVPGGFLKSNCLGLKMVRGWEN